MNGSPTLSITGVSVCRWRRTDYGTPDLSGSGEARLKGCRMNAAFLTILHKHNLRRRRLLVPTARWLGSDG